MMEATLNDFARAVASSCVLMESVTDRASADAFVAEHGAPLVVKADGLASRKIDGAVTLAIAYEMWRRNRTEFAAMTSALSQKGER